MNLRDKLLARERPTTTVPLRVADDTDARRDLEDAERALEEAEHGATSRTGQAVRKARQARDTAQQAVDDCYASITVRAMPPADFEALVAAHPPVEPAEGDEPVPDEDRDAWNPDTFPRPCFLASVVLEDGMTVEDWETFLDQNVSDAERVMLYNAAQLINVRTVDQIQVPKGWTQILNSL